MSELERFQRAFAAAMTRPDGSAELDVALARALIVHANTSAQAARDALRDNYPVLRALVGEAAFDACAGAFARTNPPGEPRLCFYGAGLDRFLASWTPFAETPWLADVATLERLVTEALFAADAPALDGAAMAERLDPDRPLTLHPAARFAAFQAPAAEIWLAHQEDSRPEALEQVQWRPGGALVTRPEEWVRVTPIDIPALAFLKGAAAGLPLAEVALAAQAARPGAGTDIADLFSSLIIAGAFA